MSVPKLTIGDTHLYSSTYVKWTGGHKDVSARLSELFTNRLTGVAG